MKSPVLALLIVVALAAAARAAPVTQYSAAPVRSLTPPWPPGVPVRVCALRVEFVEDDLTGTTGNGRMSTGFDSNLVIDPLPHDKPYFEDHLKFLKNYFETASDGAVRFDTLVVYPAADTAVYRLPNPMWHYNYNSSDALLNQRLVELFVQSVDAARQDVPFDSFNAIVVFHAGVGRDFNLGYDATPFDIPSAYISEEDVDRYTGTVPVPAGVERGIIVPEGENQREALDLDIELSVNGILVKLFGNWLGLPDLFDTQTGRSGIGRWGMMDQGSGNVNALVPALPEAWSRVYLRWVQPLTIVPSSAGDTVCLARPGASGTPQIVKIPITPDEYYLLENRDADADSVRQVVLYDAADRQLVVRYDGTMTVDGGFRVAVRASHYDFGIPGSGILMWHIDESVIRRGLPTNTVNTDLDHRGVDLVEADGAQDIGREYGFLSAGYGAELGVQEDAWYRNNAGYRAANPNAISVRFTEHSFPAARLNDGVYTRLEIGSFSDVAAVMSCVVQMSGMEPGFPVTFSSPADWAVADLNGDGRVELYFTSNDSLFVVDSLGRKTMVGHTPHGVKPVKINPPVDLDGDGRNELLLGGEQLGILEMFDTTYAARYSGQIELTEARVCPARSISGLGRILLADRTGSEGDPHQTMVVAVYDLDFHSIVVRQILSGGPVSSVPVNIESLPANRFVFVASGQAVCVSIGDGTLDEVWRKTDPKIRPDAVVLADTTANNRWVFLDGYGYVNLRGDSLWPVPQYGRPTEDWDRDGIADGGGLTGWNPAPRENAPHMSADTSWVMDVNASGDADLVGLVQPFDSMSMPLYTRVLLAAHDGTPFSGYPRACAGTEAVRPFVWARDGALDYVSELAADGRFYYSLHRLSSARSPSRFEWREDNAIINIGALRPQVHDRADWVYCWPNPAADVSRVRITTAYPVRAEVRVFDLAGRQVARLIGESTTAGALEVPWNLSGVESGVYVARVRAEGGGRTLESQLKIAVVK